MTGYIQTVFLVNFESKLKNVAVFLMGQYGPV